MKRAFHKWWWQDNKYHEKYFIMEVAWKAALEWALDSSGGNCDWDRIEKELKNE